VTHHSPYELIQHLTSPLTRNRKNSVYNPYEKRHKKKSTFITSNLGFSEWRSFLKNDQLAAALIDRFTENCHVINMKDCKSLRTKLPQKK